MTNSKILNFILRQVVDEDSCIAKKPEQYRGFVERFLEDFALADLPYKLQHQYCVFIRDVLSGEKVDGVQHPSANFIDIKRARAEDLLIDGDIDVFGTIFHENTHAIQATDIHSSKVESYYRYLMTKEDILEKEKRDYYNENYEDIFIEIEARLKAKEKLADLINRLPDYIKSQTFFRVMDFSFGFKPGEKENALSKGLKKINVFRDDKPKEDVSTIFDEIIRKHPDYLYRYPILQIEYNMDGSSKTFPELYETMDKNVKHSNRALYLAIIKRGNFIKLENFENDLDFLLNYDIKNKESGVPTTLIYMFMFNKLIESIIENPEESKQKTCAIIYKVNELLKQIEEKGENATSSEKSFIFALNKKDRKTKTSIIDILNRAQEKYREQNPEAVLMANAFNSTTKEQRTKGMEYLVDSHLENMPTVVSDEKPQTNQSRQETNGQENR